jgi:uncharacterized protein (TIGR03382 family)
MKPTSICKLLLCAFLVSSASPAPGSIVMIDSFNQVHTDGNSATLDQSTNPSLSSTVTQTLTTGTSTDAISTTRTLSTDIPSPGYAFESGEYATTAAQPIGNELRLGNGLTSDHATPSHTTHKVEWSGITGANQQLLDNIGVSSLGGIHFIIRIDAGSNRSADYTADQVFDITLWNGAKSAGFRGIMTNDDFLSPDDIYVTLSAFGSATAGFDANAIDRINFQTSLEFTRGDTPILENVVLIKQITAIPEPSTSAFAVGALGLALFRRRRR